MRWTKLVTSVRGKIEFPAARPTLTWAFAASAVFGGSVAQAKHDDRPRSALTAEQTTAQMTLDEKLSLVDGGGSSDASCVGRTPAISRLGIPALCMGDGPAGVGNGLTKVTIFPAPISLASTWDINLAQDYGAAQAEEQKGKGRNVALLPTVNILRTPLWGRAAETLGEDPVLSGVLGSAITRGVQSQHVIAMPKHFAVNNQETDRFGDAPGWLAVNAVVSERALRELYLPAFDSVVHDGGAQSIMCAYNRVNGDYACDNAHLLGILRGEWKFEGFVTSDWLFAGRSTVRSIKAGEDQLMPGGASPYGLDDYYGSPLRKALRDGAVSVEELNQMVEHILNGMRHVGVASPQKSAADVDVRTAAHVALARRIAADGSVLLKNDNHTLPIGRQDETIAIIGADAGSAQQITEAYGGFVPEDSSHPVTTPVEAITARARGYKIIVAAGTAGVRPLTPIPAARVLSPEGTSGGWTALYFSDAAGKGKILRKQGHVSVPDATSLAPLGARSARWDGIIVPDRSGAYRFSVYGGGAARIRVNGRSVASYEKEEFNEVADGTVMLSAHRSVRISVEYDPTTAIFARRLSVGWAEPSNVRANAIAAAKKANIAVVFVNDIVSEGADRPGLELPGDQDALISAIAHVNPHTVVVLNTVGPVLMPWRHDVAAIVEAWYAGEGNADGITDVMFGDVDPSGRLPETFPQSDAEGRATGVPSAVPGVNLVARYDENLDVGYRYYQRHHIVPEFPFGYGLSYTKFSLSGLRVDGHLAHVTVRNVGPVQGSAVIQLYLGFPQDVGEPPNQLRAFRKIALAPGDQRTVDFKLTPEMFRYWSEKTATWATSAGPYDLSVGFSSEDRPVHAEITP